MLNERAGEDVTRHDYGFASHGAMERVVSPPQCPECGWCRWLSDPDRNDCGCDGGCCDESWERLPDGSPRPDYTEAMRD